MEPVRGVRGIIATEIVVSTQLDPFLTLKALSSYGGMGIRTLRYHIADTVRPLPCYKVGSKILVRRSEFDAWIAAFRKEGNPELDALLAGFDKSSQRCGQARVAGPWSE